MPIATPTLRGTVRNGVIVFSSGTTLPEGTEVAISIPSSEKVISLPAEWVEETAAWEKLSDEAWSTIDWGEGEIARDSG